MSRPTNSDPRRKVPCESYLEGDCQFRDRTTSVYGDGSVDDLCPYNHNDSVLMDIFPNAAVYEQRARRGEPLIVNTVGVRSELERERLYGEMDAHDEAARSAEGRRPSDDDDDDNDPPHAVRGGRPVPAERPPPPSATSAPQMSLRSAASRVPCESLLETGRCPLHEASPMLCPYNHDVEMLRLVFPFHPALQPNFNSSAARGRAAAATSREPPPNIMRRTANHYADPHAAAGLDMRRRITEMMLRGDRNDGAGHHHRHQPSHAASSSAAAGQQHYVISAERTVGTVSTNGSTMACYRHFGSGDCRHGSSCRFSHDRNACSRTDCRRYLGSRCPLGERCPMVHDPVKRSHVPCKHYLQGNCRVGDRCYRNHNDDELRLLLPYAPIFLPGGRLGEIQRGRGLAAGTSIAVDDSDDGAGNSDDDADECCICMVGMQATQRCNTLRCGHAFHERCISSWVKENRSCPLCRMKLQ